MKTRLALAVIGTLSGFFQGLAASPTSETAAAFGARPAVSQVSLSPDGTRIAFVGPLAGEGSALYVTTATEGAQPRRVAVANGLPERLGECRWATNAKLICLIYGQKPVADFVMPGGVRGSIFQNLTVVPADGGSDVAPAKQVMLGGGAVVDWLPGQPDTVLAGVPIGRPYGAFNFGLVQYDLTKGTARTPDQYSRCYGGCLTDGLGQIRIDAVEATPGIIAYRYRAADGPEWRPFGSYRPLSGEGFAPAAVDPSTNLAWGFRKRDGRLAVYTKALDAGMAETLVYAHPDVDVDGIVRIGRKQRVVGVSYVTDALHFRYTDPDLAALAASLAKALPTTPIIRIVDASDDEKRLLILAASDVDAGRYYLLDRNSRQLQRLMDVRPQLAGISLAPMKAVSYAATDGAAIPAYLTLPSTALRSGAAIVLPHGGPSARDEWGFDWLVQYFADRGYAVLQPEFRGSDGYGDDWFRDQGFSQWRAAIDDINSGARWLIAQGLADPARIAIFGWSYGGYAALQAAAIEPKLYKAVVAVAPVTDVGMIRGQLIRYQSRATINHVLGRDIKDDASPLNNAARISAPVMLVHGTFDRNVSYDHSRRMALRLNDVGRPPTLLTFPKLDHYLDDAAARTKLLEQSDTFIRAAF